MELLSMLLMALIGAVIAQVSTGQEENKPEPTGGEGGEGGGLDQEQLEGMTDDELKVAGGAPQAATAGVQDAGKEVGEEGAKAKEGQEGGEPGVKAAAETPEKLYAGKYKTVDDLFKGAKNAGKVLGYSEGYVEKIIELAKKTGEVEVIEDLYKEVDALISRNAKAVEAERAAAALEPTQATQEAETGTDAEERAILRFALDETIQAVLQSEIARELQGQGVAIPENFLYDTKATKAFMAKLKVDLPATWFEMRQLIERTYNARFADGRKVQEAFRGVDAHNENSRKTEQQMIKEYAERIGLKLSDEELKAIIAEAEKEQSVFEDRYGSRYLKENALFNHWYLANRDKIAEQIRISAELNGRKQHKEDLEEMRKRSPQTVSTSNLAGARKQEPSPVDVESPDEVESLDDTHPLLFGTKQRK